MPECLKTSIKEKSLLEKLCHVSFILIQNYVYIYILIVQGVLDDYE